MTDGNGNGHSQDANGNSGGKKRLNQADFIGMALMLEEDFRNKLVFVPSKKSWFIILGDKPIILRRLEDAAVRKRIWAWGLSYGVFLLNRSILKLLTQAEVMLQADEELITDYLWVEEYRLYPKREESD